MCEQEDDWVDVVKNLKCRSRMGIVHPPSPQSSRGGYKLARRLSSPKYRQIKFLLARSSNRIDEEKELFVDQTSSVARSRSSGSSRAPQMEYFNLRNRNTRTWPVPVQLLPSEVESRITTPPPSSSLCSSNSAVHTTQRVQSLCKRSGTPCRRLVSRYSDCVQCLIRFFEVKDYLGGGGLGSVKSGRSKMSRVSSKKGYSHIR